MEILNQFDNLVDNITNNTKEPIVENNEDNDIVENNDIDNQDTDDIDNPDNPNNIKEDIEGTPDYSDNALYAYLQSKGIKDPKKISFVDEDGNETETDFESLTNEEKVSLLQEVANPGISDYEYQVINYLRKNNATLDQVIDHFAQQRLDEYLNQNPDKVHQKVYSIDEYSDDELYLADLKSKYNDFTDEELLSELERAKEDEDLFHKKTEVLRNTYKAQEDQERAAAEQREAQQYEDLRTNLMTAASSFNEIALDYTDPESDSLEIDENDKTMMMSYLLDQDADGKSQLIKDLNDPDALIELAWLRTRGADTLSEITKYYKKLLSDERKETKRLQAQIDKLGGKKSKSTIVDKDSTKNNSNGAFGYFDNML